MPRLREMKEAARSQHAISVAQISGTKGGPMGFEDSDEEDEQVWEPGSSTSATLSSLTVFSTFQGDGRPLKKKEIMESFVNFDEWLKGKVSEIVEGEKSKSLEVFQ